MKAVRTETLEALEAEVEVEKGKEVAAEKDSALERAQERVADSPLALYGHLHWCARPELAS